MAMQNRTKHMHSEVIIMGRRGLPSLSRWGNVWLGRISHLSFVASSLWTSLTRNSLRRKTDTYEATLRSNGDTSSCHGLNEITRTTCSLLPWIEGKNRQALGYVLWSNCFVIHVNCSINQITFMWCCDRCFYLSTSPRRLSEPVSQHSTVETSNCKTSLSIRTYNPICLISPPLLPLSPLPLLNEVLITSSLGKEHVTCVYTSITLFLSLIIFISSFFPNWLSNLNTAYDKSDAQWCTRQQDDNYTIS